MKQQPDGFNVRKRTSGFVYWEGIVAETMRARVTLLFWLQNTKQGWCLGGGDGNISASPLSVPKWYYCC